jgi:hypothetical protein
MTPVPLFSSFIPAYIYEQKWVYNLISETLYYINIFLINKAYIFLKSSNDNVWSNF